jgi:hypothetical protein
MSYRTVAIAPAFALGLALATAGVAHAQSTPSTPDTITVPKVTVETSPGTLISLREVAAIGTGVVVGAALWHVVIGHSFVLAGAAIGGWIGDWCYGTHAASAMHTGG